MRKVDNQFYREIWRFDENPEKNPEKFVYQMSFWKTKITISQERCKPSICEEIWRFDENPEKIRLSDNFPEIKIIMSYEKSWLSILWRNLNIWWKSGKIRKNLGKIWEKSGENPGKIREKSGKNPGNIRKKINHIIFDK